jgi:hypothetical protein
MPNKIGLGSLYSFGAAPIQPSSGPTERTQSLPPNAPRKGYGTIPIRLTSQDTWDWTFERKHVFVYIRLEYDDVFPLTGRHHTWVCAKFDSYGKETFCSGDRTD